MNVLLRVDAGPQIGTGHLMRCLTVADTLARRGASCLFASRGLPDYLRELIQARGHRVQPLPLHPEQREAGDLAHAVWLGATQAADAADTLAAMHGTAWDWLVVDHYALDARWERRVRAAAGQILVLDDLADRAHDCDILLDQNLYHDALSRYLGKVPETCQLLLGPRFALLRDEFHRLREHLQPRNGAVERLLVFFGGMDTHDYTGKALAALGEMALEGIHIDVVIGAQHPQRTQLEQLCQVRGYSCHVQTPHMAQLMAQADLALGAGGIACWERCALGLPALALGTAPNQRQQLTDAARKGLLYSVDTPGELAATIKLHLDALIGNPALRNYLSSNGMAAVDGLGRLRLAGRMGCTGIKLRQAAPGDAVALHAWRNHASIRAASNSTEQIAWEDHQRWLAHVLADPQRHLLIAEADQQPVGVVRFDNQGQASEISLYKVPDAAVQCRGADLLRSAEDWLRAHCPEVTKVHAMVKSDNIPSNALFKAAGYDAEPCRYTRKLMRHV